VNQVLIASPISEKFRAFLIDKNYELIIYSNESELPTADFQMITGIITSNKLVLNKSEIEKYPNLKWIGRIGSGMEIIDVEYCKQKNIQCESSPNGIANSVAEHITGMLLSLNKNIHSSFEEIKNKQWIREPNRGIELENQTIGIIGYGHTGNAFAKKMSVFTNSIIAYDKYKKGFSNEFVQEVSLEELKEKAAIISFHLPLNEETKHYYNEEFLSSMKKNHLLINSSRGAIADTSVILKGLENGKIKGACLDVLEEEKNINEVLNTENNIIEKLLKHNVIITPHIAGYSHNATEKMSQELMDKIRF
jgi:D-3-phosphoglycerate dehydrogenase